MFYRTRVFDDMFHMLNGLDPASRAQPALPSREKGSTLPAGYPAVEAFRQDDGLVVRAELPGVDSEGLEVTVDDGRLILRGEKKDTRETKDSDVYFREVSYGRFERSFGLPEGADTETISARFENGVLEVRVPVKGLEQGSRRIPIAGLTDGKKKGPKAA